MGPQGARVPRAGYSEEIGKLVIGGSKSYITSTQLRRLGLQGTLEWRPHPNFTTTLDGFYSNFKDDQIKRGIELPLQWGASTTVLQPNTTIEGDLITGGTFNEVEGVVRNDAFQRHAELYAFGWNGKWTGDDGWNAMVDISLSKTDRNELVLETYTGTGRGQGVGATDTIGFSVSDNGYFFTHQLNYGDWNLMQLTSPLGWGGTQVQENGVGFTNGQEGYYNDRIIEDELLQYRLEIERELDGFLKSVKVGLNYTDRSKKLTPDEYFLSIKANTNGTQSLPIPQEYRLGVSNQDYLGLGPIISYDPVALVRESGLFNFIVNPYGDVVVKAYDVTERLMTAYWQADIDQEIGAATLTGNFGVQAIFTDQNSNGASAIYQGARPNGSPIIGVAVRNASTDYTDVLPSLNLSLRLPGDFVIRFGAAREIIRPRLDDMRATLSYNYEFVTVNNVQYAVPRGSGGNPDLRPWRANAVDLTFEKYFGNQGYLAAQFFYKDLKSYIYSIDQQVSTADLALAPPGQQYVIFPMGTLNIPLNGQGGTLYGVELAGTLPFGEMIGALDGFGVTGGVSLTETEIAPNPGAPPEDIPGYSKWVANGTAYFEKWGFSARGSIRYRSTFVGEVSGFGASRTRRRAAPETIVDAQIGYTFDDGMLGGLSLFLQGQNLTDEPFVTMNPNAPNQIIDFQRYGRRFLAGATFKF